jgi:hypothetical protein
VVKKMTGILLISTGKYDRFVKPLLDSLDKNFLTNQKKKYYLFTDKDFVDERVNHIKIESRQIF